MAEKMRVILPDEIKRAIWLRGLIMFLFVIAFCLLTAEWQNHQTAVLHQNCRNTNQGNTRINQILDQLAKNTQTSPALTPAQRTERAAGYRELHLPISSSC